MNVNWAEAQTLLEEGDILLFLAKKNILSASYWIGRYTHSPYSHTSLASLDGDVWDCVEFREFIGSRKHPLIEEIQRGEIIHVYRIMRRFQAVRFSEETGRYESKNYEFDSQTARNITDYAKGLIQRKIKYSWSLIARMALYFIPIIRLFAYNNLEELQADAFVCSTLVSRAYRVHFIDLIPGLPDYLTQPGDIAKSGLVQYLFTIQAEKK